METGRDFLASCHQIASSREIGEGFASVIGLVLTMAADGFVDKPLLSSHLAQALMYRPKAANESCWSNSVGRRCIERGRCQLKNNATQGGFLLRFFATSLIRDIYYSDIGYSYWDYIERPRSIVCSISVPHSAQRYATASTPSSNMIGTMDLTPMTVPHLGHN
jgi:hypothetical protein